MRPAPPPSRTSPGAAPGGKARPTPTSRGAQLLRAELRQRRRQRTRPARTRGQRRGVCDGSAPRVPAGLAPARFPSPRARLKWRREQVRSEGLGVTPGPGAQRRGRVSAGTARRRPAQPPLATACGTAGREGGQGRQAQPLGRHGHGASPPEAAPSPARPFLSPAPAVRPPRPLPTPARRRPPAASGRSPGASPPPRPDSRDAGSVARGAQLFKVGALFSSIFFIMINFKPLTGRKYHPCTRRDDEHLPFCHLCLTRPHANTAPRPRFPGPLSRSRVCQARGRCCAILHRHVSP